METNNPNLVINELLKSSELTDAIKKIEIDWIKNRVYSSDSEILTKLNLVGKDGDELSNTGRLLLSRILLDFKAQIKIGDTFDKYKISKVIRIGKNSSTFLAKHNFIGNVVVVKFVRPGAAENIQEILQKISTIKNVENIVTAIDMFQVVLKDLFARPIELKCIVYPYIEGSTLRAFMQNGHQPITAHLIATFIKQTSKILFQLEKSGIYHGDLHDENIVVQLSDSGALSFKIIDISYGIVGSRTIEECKNTDLVNFRRHVWSFLKSQKSYLKKMSLRKYLGTDIFNLVSSIYSTQNMSFGDINDLFNRNPLHEEFLRKKARFLEDKFSVPNQFKLQRYEEITDPEVAVKLFHPFDELMEHVKNFSNLAMSGNRGSGKSTYLASLAFFPNSENQIVDFKEIFGIYFPCRQGEFRQLSDSLVKDVESASKRSKHILVIKIIRRTLESIAEGIETRKILNTVSYTKLRSFLTRLVDEGEVISLEPSVVSEIRNLVSFIVRVELKEIDNLFKLSGVAHGKQLSEIDLIEFFQIIKSTYPELANTKFHLLFDDAGRPNIPVRMQNTINDLMMSSNAVYCVKLSAERFTYSFKTTDNKSLENGHDYYDYDISRLFLYAARTKGLDKEKVADYFFNIIKKRLEYFKYKSNNIYEYLGSLPDIKFEAFVSSLANSRRNAYYHSWDMVWKIADRNPRNLLELISEIFSASNIGPSSEVDLIAKRFQDRGIRSVSEKRLKSLSQVSGTLTVNGERLSAGKLIFESTTAIGSVFKIYLKSERGKKRKDQYLAIERNNTELINEEAEKILNEMIRFGVLDDSTFDVSRDDLVKKPIYTLNRIYCPVFGIGYRRDQHLRLSKAKFDEVFLFPKNFINDGTRRLRANRVDEDSSVEGFTRDLFGDEV